MNISLKYTAIGFYTMMVKRFLGPFWLRRRYLGKTQWLSRDAIYDLQLELLQKLVRHSYTTVPYYRKLMDAMGIKPDDVKSLDDIRHFPVLTKAEVLRAGASIVSTAYPGFIIRKAYTGGTTGTPLILYRDIFSISNEHAFLRRQWDWAGIRSSDVCAYLTGRIIVPPDTVSGKLYKYDASQKELVLSTYHLSKGNAGAYVNAMREIGASAIVGYPSAVTFLARYCIDSGVRLSLKAALTSSEVLSGSMRSTIKQAFGCGVFDYYGSAERVCYIHSCEHERYHIIPEFGLTELMPIEGDAEGKCRIVSTGFWNFSMPLIRYDMGDVAIPDDGACQCGRHYRMVKSIGGRQVDTIRTASGREFGSAILTHLLYGTDHITESQIVQDDIDTITIKYVPGPGFSDSDLGSFRDLIVKHLPSELKVDLQKVDFVERTSSGKIRPVVSKL